MSGHDRSEGGRLRRNLGIAVAALLALVFAGVGARPALAAGTTRWVNNTATPGTAPGTSCANPGYSTIELAIAAASSGDTIHVCPGTYTEALPVTISNLTLQGSDPPRAGAGDSSCTSSMTPDTTVDTVIQQVSLAGGVVLSANNITFENFWVQGNSGGDGVDTTPTSSGYTIANNVFYNNVFGLYFNSGGATPSVAENNCFANNNVTGPANGNGIYEDQGITNATVTNNSFVDNTNAAILLVTETNVTISGNSSTDDADLVDVFQGTGGTITGNSATNDVYGGVYVCGATGLDVDHNTTVGGSDPLAAGTYIDGPADTQQTPACTQSTNLTISSNQSTSVAYGFYAGAGAMTGSTVQGETDTGSSQDGIYTASGGNTFKGNSASGSAAFDCHDTTSGSGTAATANTWTADSGAKSSPPGICAGPPPNVAEFPAGPPAMAIVALGLLVATAARRRWQR